MREFSMNNLNTRFDQRIIKQSIRHVLWVSILTKNVILIILREHRHGFQSW